VTEYDTDDCKGEGFSVFLGTDRCQDGVSFSSPCSDAASVTPAVLLSLIAVAAASFVLGF